MTKWADIFVIAPASANTINKIACGIADNLLLQTALAFDTYNKTIILSPAANTAMIENQITKESLEKLKTVGFQIVNTQTKELACKVIGNGAMAEPLDIFHTTCKELLKDSYWLNRNVVLSGGGTVEKIDEVRYISNFSSGKMAFSLAKALYYKGANVSLVSSKEDENLPKDINLIKVESSKEMFENLEVQIKEAKKDSLKQPFFFMVAAVSDYIVANPKKEKLKKEQVGETFNLELKQNIDILNSLNKDEIISIGFKAEIDKKEARNSAISMLDKKKIDAVCLNILDENNSFGSESNTIELILKDGKSAMFSGLKLDISKAILEKLQVEFK
jgi:phosphopantothenoylcysteine decarboxylase/phosphopantothenate--cysteine ligase